MIHGGCDAYLAHVVDKRSEKLGATPDVPIVRNFKDVFLADIAG